MNSRTHLILVALVAASTTIACGLGGKGDLGSDQDAVNDGGSGGASSAQPGTTAGGVFSGGADVGAGGLVTGPGGAGFSGAPGQAGAGNPSKPGQVVPCGASTCAAGQECCNPSCGICVEPGGSCIEMDCGNPPPNCGGASTPCNPGMAWADAGSDCSGAGADCTQGFSWSVADCGCVADVPCGPSACTGGDVCCNESCGICTEPGGACTEQLCGTPPSGTCTTDGDCQLVDNYCGGCNCLALTDPNDAPTCADPWNCFAEPCLTATGAACVSGECVVSY